ncbi:MAG: hypothetical protein ABFD92_21520 [Planctomycetaceae bacterium]
MLYRNNNDAYGAAGPFEAESLNAVVENMMPAFREWAGDEWQMHAEMCRDTDTDPGDEDKFRDAAIDRMRAECLAGLEVITPTNAESRRYEPDEADARLRDAAPDLLAACREALYWLDPDSRGEEACVKMIIAAIAKATGDQPCN